MSAQPRPRARIRHWTPAEDATLRQHYPAEGPRCAHRLPGRNAVSVKGRAVRLQVTCIRPWDAAAERLRAELGNRPPATLGERIINWRLRRGWTQMRLARAIGIWQTGLARIEADAFEPRMSTLVAICRTTGLSADYLLLGD